MAEIGMIGQTLSHYTILKKLGEGGMGAVYLAEDSRLDRRVALKVLPVGVASDPERLARFEREAKAVAALNHPNIVTVHSIERHEEIRFITMELIEGKTLEALIAPGGLGLETFFEVAIPLADALAVAHRKGITHRDLKPANVMVTDEDRLVKILDFGLAKFQPESTGSLEMMATLPAAVGLTRSGETPGTVPYMSPEQLAAKPIDQRSDIFSLGIILYEMLTGERPFQGESVTVLASAILGGAPRAVSERRPGLPRHLERIVSRCLQRDPRARFQTARDVCNELEALRREIESGGSPASPEIPELPLSGPAGIPTPAGRRGWRSWTAVLVAVVAVAALATILHRTVWTREREAPPALVAAASSGAAEAPSKSSIAVLAFADMSPDKDQQYLSDGLAEELLNLLARIPELRVTARTSAFSFKGQDLEIQEIARRLGVGHIVEGSVRKAGDRVRITAQLIEGASGTQIWSERYDRTLNDIFAVQDEIAADVVAKLQVTLLAGMPTVEVADPEAYALYLQARHLMFEVGRTEGLEKAVERFRQALARDPEYTAARSGLAFAYLRQADFGLRAFDEGVRLARTEIERVLAVDPNHAPAHAMLARIAIQSDLDLAAASTHLRRALRLAPRDGEILGEAALLADLLGHGAEAIAVCEYLVARDPANGGLYSDLGSSYYLAGRLEEALASFRTAVMLHPGQFFVHYMIGVSLLLQGEPEAALESMAQEAREEARLLLEAMAHQALGRPAAADEALDMAIEKHEQSWSYNIASALAFRGEADRAFEWLDKAVARRDSGLKQIAVDPLFADLHPDPRWLPFLRKIGMAPEQLAAIEFEIELPDQAPEPEPSSLQEPAT